MDLTSTSAIEITTLALNGLSARHNAIAANIANAETPGYKRTDVKFEDQLVKIINETNSLEAEKVKTSMTLMYNPNAITTLNLNKDSSNQKDLYGDFKPQIMSPDNPAIKPDGNNVSIEYEMAELAKNGTRYAAIATFQEKMFRGLQDVIQKGGS